MTGTLEKLVKANSTEGKTENTRFTHGFKLKDVHGYIHTHVNMALNYIIAWIQ